MDKIGRAARRSVDTHVKHTIAKPRIASSLQRVSALLGLVPDLREHCRIISRPSRIHIFPHIYT